MSHRLTHKKGLASLMLSLVAVSACQMPAPMVTQDQLQGAWRIESIAGAGVMDYSPATLIFAARGKLLGNASCNRLVGRYQWRASGQWRVSRLAIAEPQRTTRKQCPPALMNQEAKLLKFLPGRYQVTINHNILVLYNSEDHVVLRAARAP